VRRDWSLEWLWDAYRRTLLCASDSTAADVHVWRMGDIAGHAHCPCLVWSRAVACLCWSYRVAGVAPFVSFVVCFLALHAMSRDAVLCFLAERVPHVSHRRQPRPPASWCHFLHRTAFQALYTTSGRLSTCSKKYMFASCRHFLVRTVVPQKPSTPAGSIVPSTSHMCVFCDATLSILDRRSRKSLKRDQSRIPGDA